VCRVIVIHDYRGYGFHVTAVPTDENADVKVRQHFSSRRETAR
jgi:hypothetical protein